MRIKPGKILSGGLHGIEQVGKEKRKRRRIFNAFQLVLNDSAANPVLPEPLCKLPLA
ncbi:MAG: hypothetical protein RLZZ142_2420 [Verrucomicrobiota bacterium]|jgi:hypothetical protein